jgi:hypothetical protein
VINQGRNEAVAISRQRDNERTIAAAELRRQAKAIRHGGESIHRDELIVAARAVRGSAFGSVAGTWRWIGRGFAGVVVRRATV